jgi:simple sugar transport system substrate-binding protein
MKLKSRLVVAAALAATTAGAVVAVSAPAQAARKQITIAVITHADGGSFWSVVKKGAEKAAQQTGVKLLWEGSNNDPQKQAQYIDAAVQQKVDGIAISIPNPGAIKASIAKATAAGIPVVSLNSGSNDYKSFGAITHVGQDESIAGAGAGSKFAATGAKHLLCVIGEQGNQALEARCAGAKSTFGGTVDNIYVKGDADLATTQQQIAAKLSADKTIDAVLSLNPDVAITAVAAVKSAGSSAKVGTFDMSGPVTADIANGSILFAVDQQQYLQGYLAVNFLWLDIVNANTVGGGLPVNTGPGFVTKANVSQVMALAKAGTR